MPWQPAPKMHVQLDVSQVRSQRNRWLESAGSANSTHMRATSRGVSGTDPAYVAPCGACGLARVPVCRRLDHEAGRGGPDQASTRSRPARPGHLTPPGACAAGYPRTMSTVSVPGAKVALSTASVYPGSCASAFATAARLGYDAVEVMVWTDPVSQEAGAVAALAEHHGIPVVSVHAPTLLLTQRIWGPDTWTKVDNSIALAREVGASTVVLHPPFRWQKEYASEFVEGVAIREHES